MTCYTCFYTAPFESADWCECRRCGSPQCPSCYDRGQRCEACGHEPKDAFEEDGEDDDTNDPKPAPEGEHDWRMTL